MEAEVIKPPFKLIWLDTHAIISIARALNDRKVSTEEKQKNKELVDLIIELTDAGKILCPEGDQDLECECGQRLVNEIRDLQTSLSRGTKMKTYKAVHEWQEQQVMYAYINNEKNVIFNWEDMFYRNPIKEIEEKSPFIVSVRHTTPKKELEEIQKSNNEIAKIWEALRMKNKSEKKKYAQVLKEEYTGFGKSFYSHLIFLLNKQLKGEKPSFEEMLKCIDLVGRPITIWNHLKGEPEGTEGLLKFYFSDDYKKIPYVDISCKLVSELITGNEKIKPSDVMDVHQISASLPYAHYMVVDGAMRDILSNKIKISRSYQTNIIRFSELKKLLLEIKG